MKGLCAITLLTMLTSRVCFSDHFTLSTSEVQSDCTCPGDQLIYECSLSNDSAIATIWQGSSFDCGSNNAVNEILARHGRFNSDQGQVIGSCNHGNIVARIIGIVNGNFISQLNITVTSDMNNKTIECSKVDINLNRTTVGMTTVVVATEVILILDNVHLADVRRGQFTFKWLINNINMCPIDYTITSTCGTCPTVTVNTSVTCFVVSQRSLPNICTFAIQIQICGKFYTNASAHNLNIMSKSPDPPELKSTPHYEQGNLVTIQTTLTQNVSQIFNISDGIDGSPISYTIIYSDPTSGATCFNTTISAISCEKGVCSHVFKISSLRSKSMCLSITALNVKVFATNVLGDGPVSDPITIPSGFGIPSNKQGLITYLVSGCTSVLLILGVCTTTVIVTLVVRHKRRVKQSHTNEQNEEATYEEIDEFQQFSKCIDTTKNMAYCDIQKIETPESK